MKIEEVLEFRRACDEGIRYARTHANQTPEQFFDGCVADDAVWDDMGAAGFFCKEFSVNCGGPCLCNVSGIDPRWAKVRENFIEACRG